MRGWFLVLTICGLVLPYWFFVPWVLQHGPNLVLLITELFSTKIGAFFGVDVGLSAVTAIAFIRREGAQLRMQHLWLPVAAICLVGVSCGLPLFLFMRESQTTAPRAARGL